MEAIEPRTQRHMQTATQSSSPHHRPLDPAVTLLNLQYTEIADRTVGKMCTEKKSDPRSAFSQQASAESEMKGNERE